MPYSYDSSHNAAHQMSGRNGQPVRSITIHHWGKDGQRFDNVVDFLCSFRPKNPSSAHYVTQDGRASCIVDPDDTAYHAGVWARNLDSIGIECRPEATDGDYRTLAELVRDLRAVYGNVPLRKHSDWKNTACPGRYDLARIEREILALDAPAPAPAPPKPEPPRYESETLTMNPYVAYANAASRYYLIVPGYPKPFAVPLLKMTPTTRALTRIEVGDGSWESFAKTVTFV